MNDDSHKSNIKTISKLFFIIIILVIFLFFVYNNNSNLKCKYSVSK